MSLNDKLSVAIADIDIVAAQPQTNIARVEELISSLAVNPDLIVLPELFSTGYINDRDRAWALAETIDGPTLTEIRRLARTHNMAIAGSALCKEADEMYNRGFIIEPNGDTAYYDKHHLFCMSQESAVCAPGRRQPPVVRFRGWNLALAICYDVRFPVWLRNTDNRYDALVLPANWPMQRAFAWEHLLQARAIENQCYVIGANRSGSDDYGTYDAMSEIYDFKGRPVGQRMGSCLVASLDRPKMRAWREKMPVWRDADPFKLV